MHNFSVYSALWISVGLMACAMLARESFPRAMRAFSACLCIVLLLRYLWWRFACSIPADQNSCQQIWAWVFLAFESLSVLSSVTCLFFMSRSITRCPDKILPPEFADAPVDVFIATYNEPYDVLERTIVGAMAIQHADFRVWVLDDGARGWVRDLAQELGAHYVHRVKGKHAKAGNVNNGLENALNCGRKPEFILLLDADFVPLQNILQRTLGLFSEADVGIVQTPQHFFNSDPVQHNLVCAAHWPDEQRFFFNTLLSCKDAWGAAFCCGTSAVFRVEALIAARGMATETVTEDMLTTFRFIESGYRTIFLNEKLSLGLAPEDVGAYVSQRARWCLGAIQQIYTRWSFAGSAKLGFIARLSALDGTLYWISGASFKLMMITGPLIFWWTGTTVVASSVDDIVTYFAPSLACSLIFMNVHAHKRILPVMTDVTQLMSSFAVTGTVAVALIKPWGHPFRVTAKGVDSDSIVVHWRIFLPFFAILLATLFGMILNIPRYSALFGSTGYEINVFWSLFNIAVLTLACFVCIDLPRDLQADMFLSGESATLNLSNGAQVPCIVREISLSGANVDVPMGKLRADDTGVLFLNDGVSVAFDCAQNLPDGLALHFCEDRAVRRQLIVRLFTQYRDNPAPPIRIRRVLAAVSKRLIA